MEIQAPKNESFFYTGKENYFLGILPSDPDSHEKDGYLKMVNIAKTYFSAGLYDPIVEYLNEGRYHIRIWAAVLTLEYGEPDAKLRKKCIKSIKKILDSSALQLSVQQYEFFRAYITEAKLAGKG